LDIQKAILLDTLTNVMDLSVTDGQMIVGATSLTGDANGDSKVDVTDIVNLVAFINGRHPAGFDAAAIDMDGNGLWDISDITKLVVVINAAGTTIRSSSTSEAPLTVEALSIYHAGESPMGNNLFVRQSEKDPSQVEICMDNLDEVQAFQADLILPAGVTLAEDRFAQCPERNSGQMFTIGKVAENHYRLLSYALQVDAAFPGKSGVLASLQLEGMEGLSDGKYPIVMQQAVLTGMDLATVVSYAYDAVLTIGGQTEADDSISLGTEAGSRLWIKGKALCEVIIWDMAGKQIVQKKLDGADSFSVPLANGNYIVRAKSKTVQDCLKKVAVK